MKQADPNLLIGLLRKEGLKVTGPRRAICSVLTKGDRDHLTASEIRVLAEEELGGPIDLSTVYRTIDALEKAGGVRHVYVAHGPGVVHLDEVFDHHHVTCEVCGKTFDLPIEELSELAHSVEERYGFRADTLRFLLVGRCAEHSDE